MFLSTFVRSFSILAPFFYAQFPPCFSSNFKYLASIVTRSRGGKKSLDPLFPVLNPRLEFKFLPPLRFSSFVACKK